MHRMKQKVLRSLVLVLVALSLCGLAYRDDTPMLTVSSEPAVRANAVAESSVAADSPAEGREREPVARMATGHFVLGPGRRLPITLGGLDSATLKLYAVPAERAREVFPLLGVHGPGVDPLARLSRALSADAVLSVKPADPDLAESEVEVDVFAKVRGDLVLAMLEAPHLKRVALLERGELGAVMKIGASDGLVWVTNTRTASPVAGASVRVSQGDSVRFLGKTDDKGLVRLPKQTTLRLPYDGDEDAYEPLVATVEWGAHAALASERWNLGISPWEFDVPTTYSTEADEFTGMVTAERGIYRPKETVHLLGVLRKRKKNGSLEAPKGDVNLGVQAPDGSSVLSRRVPLTEFGTFHAELDLGAHAALGRYFVTVQRGETEIGGQFDVGEYRTARFEVNVGEANNAAETLSASVAARYLYGAPVQQAHVDWTVSVRPGAPPTNDAFTYGATDRFGMLEPIASGEGITDEEGRLELAFDASALPDPKARPSQILDVVVEASVRDAGGDTIVGRSMRRLFRGRSAVGIRSNDWVVDPKRGWSVDVQAVDAAGKKLSGERVRLELVRRHWMSVASRRGGVTRYEGGWRDDLVQKKTVATRSGPLRVHFATPGGGTYRLRAFIDGQETFAETSVWAYGESAYGGWDNHPRIDVKLDRESYRPGDRAKVLVASPYQEALALVTVERDGVLFAEPRRLTGGKPIALSVSQAYLPNAFVGVALMPVGLDRAAPAAGVPFRMGYASLEVSAEERRLRVELAPDSAEHRPGEAASVAVKVTDQKGRPVRAEVTLWAADEGVLMLTGYETPSAFEPVYRARALGVATATNLLRWWQPGEELDDGSGGDYGGESTAAFRSRFLSTAFFADPVVTDGQGRARVRFELPDNLTRWRVMASVADPAERFGSAQASIVSSKPLQVMPALPRFLTQGDRAEAKVLVDNRTGRSGEAVVTFDVEGAELVGDRTRRVSVRSNEQVLVAYTVEAKEIGKLTASASVRLGDERDAFRIELPVHPATGWRTNVVGSGLIGADRRLAIALPKDTTADRTELVIDVSSGVFAGMSGAVDALLEYPHGCVEQTTSRLIPLVQLERILEQSGDPRLGTRAHRSRMEAAVAHVLAHQNDDGGFGLWPSSDSESFLTAYALWGLETAKLGGYEVPSRAVERGFAYLESHLGSDHDMHGQFDDAETAPFAAYVLARSKKKDGAFAKSLAAAERSRFSNGLLSFALGSAESPEEALTEKLLGGLDRAAVRLPKGGRVVRERPTNADLFYVGRDVRATAAAVEAMLAADRMDEAGELVAGIFAEQRKDGTWGTTYNNLWALNALGAYASRTAASTPLTDVAVRLDEKNAAVATVGPDRPLKQIVIDGRNLFANGPTAAVALAGNAASPARFSARLRSIPEARHHRPVDRGLSVTRSLGDAKSGAAVTSLRVGDLVRVSLEVTTRNTREQIAVMDYLPAGLEPVDTALKTVETTSVGARSGFYWSHRELHDERVTFFADYLPAGKHRAEYLARVTRAGSFVRPAPRAEAMYDPETYGTGAIEHVQVSP